MGHRRKPRVRLGPRVPVGAPWGSGPSRVGLGQPLREGSDPAPRRPQDMLFLGDFNADCSYVRAQDWAAIRLRSSEVFKWLIPDSADTTVGNSDCAYDRIVVCGAHLRRSLKPQSAAVRDFQEEFGLDQTQASAGRPAALGFPGLPGARRWEGPANRYRGPGPTSAPPARFTPGAPLPAPGLPSRHQRNNSGKAGRCPFAFSHRGPSWPLPPHWQQQGWTLLGASPQGQWFVDTHLAQPGVEAAFQGGARGRTAAQQDP